MTDPRRQAEITLLEASISEYHQHMTTFYRLGDQYTSRGQECYRIADRWYAQARQSTHLLQLALTRKWRLQDDR